MKNISKVVVAGVMVLGFTSLPIQRLNAQNKPIEMTNPLFQQSTLQYQAPPFNLIKDEHFKPAFERGIKLQEKEIQDIVNNPAAPTFQNTLLALEISGADLGRATGIFYNLTSSNTNPTLQAIEAEYAPIFSAHNDKIFMNSQLYNRIKSINSKTLKGEDEKLKQYYLQQFELAGANLSPADKEKMKKNQRGVGKLKYAF